MAVEVRLPVAGSRGSRASVLIFAPLAVHMTVALEISRNAGVIPTPELFVATRVCAVPFVAFVCTIGISVAVPRLVDALKVEALEFVVAAT